MELTDQVHAIYEGHAAENTEGVCRSLLLHSYTLS
jgi:hypothetical protein